MRERILVTAKENIKNFNEDGTFELHDETLVGHLVHLHTIQVSQIDKETQTLQTGVITKAEIYWEHSRELRSNEILMDIDGLVWLDFASNLEAQENDEAEEEEDEDAYSDEDES